MKFIATVGENLILFTAIIAVVVYFGYKYRKDIYAIVDYANPL